MDSPIPHARPPQYFENPSKPGTPAWINEETKNIIRYIDLLEKLELRKGQSPSDLLDKRLQLITKCVQEFHKKFIETHREELGPLVDGEAKQLYHEHMELLSNNDMYQAAPPTAEDRPHPESDQDSGNDDDDDDDDEDDDSEEESPYQDFRFREKL